jgi:hypothetical protein
MHQRKAHSDPLHLAARAFWKVVGQELPAQIVQILAQSFGIQPHQAPQELTRGHAVIGLGCLASRQGKRCAAFVTVQRLKRAMPAGISGNIRQAYFFTGVYALACRAYMIGQGISPEERNRMRQVCPSRARPVRSARLLPLPLASM